MAPIFLMTRPRLIALILALLTLVVYLPTVNCGFTSFDDNDCVTANQFVQGGFSWQNIQWAFTTGKTGNWMPLTWLSHMAVCQVFGLNAGAHHLVNVLFHASNIALLFLLLFRWTSAVWPCVFAALLFAWHPLHVESVAWVTERKDMLSTFFGLAALLAYTNHVRSSSVSRLWTRDYCLALVFFALSLMSKPMLVTLPCVLLLLDLWPLKRIQNWKLEIRVLKSLVLEKVPFFVITVAFCIITFLAQRAEGLVNSLDAIPLGDRLGNVPIAYVRYLFQTVWPVDLVAFYPFPFQISPLAIAGALLVLLLITVVVRWERERFPWWLFGWLWFLGTLFPVIGVVSFGGQAMANRFMYFPSIGLFLAVALTFQWVTVRWKKSIGVVVGIACSLLAACLVLTVNQMRYWHDDISLFSHVLEVTKDNQWFKLRDTGILHYHLGAALAKAGKTERSHGAISGSSGPASLLCSSE